MHDRANGFKLGADLNTVKPTQELEAEKPSLNIFRFKDFRRAMRLPELESKSRLHTGLILSDQLHHEEQNNCVRTNLKVKTINRL